MRWILAGLALAVLLVVPQLPLAENQEQRGVLAVLIVAAILWFGEVIPLFATALLVPVLLGILTRLPAAELTQPFFDPIIALFFGSFVLAIALSKYGWAQLAAQAITRLARGRPRLLLLLLMLAVVLLDAWISNTATVALLVPMVTAIVQKNRLRELSPRFAAALYLGLAFATAIGSMATPVGTPPNALAVRFLAEEGIALSFLDWLRVGGPIVLTLLPITWLLLIWLGGPTKKLLKFAVHPDVSPSPRAWFVLGILVLTIVLWLSEPLHGLEPGLAALLAAAVLFASRLLQTGDLSRVPFSVLLLFGGGLVLGDAVRSTGLIDLLANFFANQFGNMPFVLVLLTIGIGAVVFTTFASNTAMAAILIPLVIGIAAQTGLPLLPLVLVATFALSIDFLSPIGTPPSTIVFQAGKLKIRDFFRFGLPVTLVGLVLVVWFVLILT